MIFSLSIYLFVLVSDSLLRYESLHLFFLNHFKQTFNFNVFNKQLIIKNEVKMNEVLLLFCYFLTVQNLIFCNEKLLGVQGNLNIF